LTDFVTFNKFYVLNEKPATNRQILAHNSSGLDSLNYKTSCIGAVRKHIFMLSQLGKY